MPTRGGRWWEVVQRSLLQLLFIMCRVLSEHRMEEPGVRRSIPNKVSSFSSTSSCFWSIHTRRSAGGLGVREASVLGDQSAAFSTRCPHIMLQGG